MKALADRPVVLIGPPRIPCAGGLHHDGTEERRLVWIRAEQPVKRLWAAEQVIRSAGIGTVLAWLPHVRHEQIRRLQVAAQDRDGLVFLMRTLRTRREASAAPLRVAAPIGARWSIEVEIVKRRGAPLDRPIRLASTPGGLRSVRARRRSVRSTSALPLPGRSAAGLPAAVERRVVHTA